MDKSCTVQVGEKMVSFIEEGKVIYLISGALLVICLVSIFSGSFHGDGIDVSEREHTVKRYAVKKVSSLPELQSDENEEQENSTAADEGLTIDEIRNRYISYVVDKIKKNRIYPRKEQSMGHEGGVWFVLEIDRTGKVKRFSYVKRSIYSGLNNAAVSSVKKSLPLSAFPRQLPEKVLKIKVKMDYYLE